MGDFPGSPKSRRMANSRTSESRSRKHASNHVSGTDDDSDAPTQKEEDKPKPKERVTLQKIVTRSLVGFAMMGTFYGIIQAGHLYCILFVVLIQAEIYRELVNVRYVAAKEKKMPWFRSIQTAWFAVAMFYAYGESLYHFSRNHKQLKYIAVITQHTTTISFVLYSILFVLSVLTLKQGTVKFQLSQMMWSIVTVCIVVFQCKFIAEGILTGLFWFLFPIACVIMNDISAYFCGVTFGRMFINFPLIAMSPNKTWEGFIGAAILTLAMSFYFPLILSSLPWFICPAEEITLRPFPPPIHCDPNPVFIETLVDIPFLGSHRILPAQLHGLAYGLFASLVAPFGGFFASAIKRAYNLKDFDSFFPGHGGVMDRADCQLVMLGFSTLYYKTFIAPQSPSVDKMLFLASLMSLPDQQRLVQELMSQLREIA